MSELKYKVVLLGDPSVGKTCFLIRYVNNTFTQNHMTTIGVDVKSKKIQSSIGEVTLQIWDTAGQEKFRSLSPSYLRNADGILLLYDISNRESFDHMVNWLEAIEKYTKMDKQVMLVGNKSDLEDMRRVEFDEGQTLSKHSGYLFTEASAKEGVGVDICFQNLLKAMIKKGKPISWNKENVGLNDVTNKKKKCNCN